MKRLLLAIAVTTAIVYAAAQTTVTPSWSGVETQQLLANCQLHNSDSVVCVATDGVAFSFQGAAFVKVATQGATGPMGPQGPAGATGSAGPQGPQGIPGPVQSFNSLACGSSNQSNTGLSASSCKETTP
jgi:hypothetical protein